MVAAAEPSSPASQTADLERCVRDLLALLALPALWSGRDPRAILELLFEVMESMLSLEFAYGNSKSRDDSVEVLRSSALGLDEVRRLVAPCVDEKGAASLTVEHGGRALRLAVAPIGYRAEGGTIVVASARPDFPNITETVFLRAATNLATTGIETALAIREREEALRAKDEFLAMLGHELRNPLAPIITALQLMKLRGDVRTTREQEIIERQAGHLVRLVDDLLDVSRVTRGKVQLKLEPVELAGVVAKAVETASPLLEQRSHHLSVSVPRVRLNGDPTRLAQIVANLLTNAAKYTEPGGHIRITARRVGNEVALSVKDDGIGIVAEFLPRIFELFVQGHTTIHRTEGGLGLGLALVRNLVGLHGGTVAAFSEGPGKGSEFIVRLPALPRVAEDEARPMAPVPFARQANPRRILLVDDNVDAADLLAEILRTAGHEVVTAYDSPRALELVESMMPDIMILDIGLPVMDGYELAAKVRQRLAGRTPQLIAVTGYGQHHDRARSERAGFTTHLVKPVDADALLAAVQPAASASA
jgi:signal transduction histidine kinase/ActR/RegA family two-component response regulator